MASNQDMPDILMSNKAHFLLSGTVTKKNLLYQASETPQMSPVQHKRHHWMCGVASCAYWTLYVGRRWKMKMRKSHCYIHIIKILLMPRVHSLPQHKNPWFLHDSATVNHKLFLQQVISHFTDEPRLPCMPDLITPNAFFEDI